jgi:hypothetical protein
MSRNHIIALLITLSVLGEVVPAATRTLARQQQTTLTLPTAK